MSLEGIEYVAGLKKVIKEEETNKLKDCDASDLTIKLKQRKDSNDEKAVEFDGTPELASAFDHGSWLLVFLLSGK